MNYDEILKRFSYESEEHLHARIAELDSQNYQQNRDIINTIVLWKINRSVHLSDETLDMLNALGYLEDPLKAAEDKNVHRTVLALLSSKGIKLAIASAILHFYYPEIFPIIDQRSYRELYEEEFPAYLSADRDAKYLKLYMQYIKDCFAYKMKYCPDISFEYIDKILYQIDKEKGNTVKY